MRCYGGFTPAHAGNTPEPRSVLVVREVHPRSRGEYFLSLNGLTVPLGSPPLTRGIHNKLVRVQRDHRFTPAHAGNTMAFDKKKYIQKVHPRSRGEYESREMIISSSWGSPPLTRGILSDPDADPYTRRFTPAHAGNTYTRIRKLSIGEVHPRSRGEYMDDLRNSKNQEGSPPLTRGIRFICCMYGVWYGFTPAHAGNTIC